MNNNAMKKIPGYGWQIKGNLEAAAGNGNFSIWLRDVFHSYGEKCVIGNVDLAVRPGEFLTMAGPSGCGKSTLLRLLLGEEQAQSGIVKIGGKPRTRPDADCGIVYQAYSVFPHLTVLDNIIIGPLLSKIGVFEKILSLPHCRQIKKQAVEEARELLKITGLEKEERKYPHQLSGGMRQRVAIAQAIIMHPKVLLLDEPFTGLDPWMRGNLQKMLVDVWMRERMTIIFVTHNLEEAIYLGTRIVVLSQYYTTGKGKGVGARIVADFPIPTPHPRPIEFKTSPELNALLGIINKICAERSGESSFIGDFRLEHPDSFHTAPQEEWRK